MLYQRILPPRRFGCGGHFYLRTVFTTAAEAWKSLKVEFRAVAERYGMEWQAHESAVPSHIARQDHEVRVVFLDQGDNPVARATRNAGGPGDQPPSSLKSG